MAQRLILAIPFGVSGTRSNQSERFIAQMEYMVGRGAFVAGAVDCRGNPRGPGPRQGGNLLRRRRVPYRRPGK